MKEIFIVDAVRTPIGRFGGALSPIRADDLAAFPIETLLRRHPELDPSRIDEVILGCANQAGEDNRNVARMASLLAGLPVSVPAETVNRLCASGLSALVHGSRAIGLEEGHLYIVGGVEHMTRAPYVLSKSSSAFGRDSQLFDTSLGWRFVNPRMEALYGVDAMGQTAENVAELHSIGRSDQDRFALGSQRKTAAAQKAGRFDVEIEAVSVPRRKAEPLLFSQDEFNRPDTTLEKLARLKPAFRKDGQGSVTAGNASGINDGACALLIASGQAVAEFGWQPLARVVSWAASGIEPRLMGLGPVESSRRALERAQLTIGQIDLIEMNEAFAAQVLACLRQLGLPDDDPRLNPKGGAIALGHPLGMSGARLATTASFELQRSQSRYALCTLCVGVGQGMAAVLERA